MGSKLKNSLEGNELKQRTAPDINKFVTEIHPRSQKSNLTSVSLRTFIGRGSKKVDLEIKSTEKGV